MKRFAIVKISALGDVVQSFGVATYIRNLYPDCEIDWFADAPSIELAANHPAISNAQFFNFNHWKKQKDYKGFYSFLKKIRSKHYDYVFDLQGNLKSSILTFCLKASQKVGFGKKSVREWPNLLVTDLKFDFPKFMNKRLQYLNLVSLALENKSYETISNIEPKRSNKIAKKALIMVGSRWKAKQLSFDDWLYIVDLLINQYHLDIEVLWGDEKEKALASKIQSYNPDKIVLSPKMNLKELQDKMYQFDLALGLDSAPLHMAEYCQIPTFSFFGPTSASVYKPLSHLHGFIEGTCLFKQIPVCPKMRTCKNNKCMSFNKNEFNFLFNNWFIENFI